MINNVCRDQKKVLDIGKRRKGEGGRRKERGGGGGEKSRRGFLRPSSFPLSPRTKAAEGKRRRSLGGHDNFRTSISGLDKCGGRCMAPTNPGRLEEGGGAKIFLPVKSHDSYFFKKVSAAGFLPFLWLFAILFRNIAVQKTAKERTILVRYTDGEVLHSK